MRHTTRRRGRGRRARLTRRQKQRQIIQRGGAGCADTYREEGAILGTQGVTAWLKDVFDRYTISPRINPPTPEDTTPARTDPMISDLPVVPFMKPNEPMDTLKFILPIALTCDEEGGPLKAAFVEDLKEKALYDLRGNYGRIIHTHVKSLMQQPTYRGFSAKAGSFSPEEAQVGAVGALLGIENTFRTLLRAVVEKNDREKYSHIVENIRSLDDIYTYPLYVWAVASSIEEEIPSTASEGADDRLLPMLVPEAEVKAMMKEGLAPPAI